MTDVIIDMTADFVNGTLKARLAKMPQAIDQAAEAAVDEVATFVVMMAKILVHVDTGTLKKTIRKEHGGTRRLERRVRAGGYFVNPKSGRICDYAAYVEARYPFLRPAANMGTGRLKTLLKQGIIERV